MANKPIEDAPVSDSLHIDPLLLLQKELFLRTTTSTTPMHVWTINFRVPLSCSIFLPTALENKAICFTYGLKVLRQYFNETCIFDYDANDRSLLWRKENEASLERALNRSILFFFPVPGLLLTPVAKLLPILTIGFQCKRSIPGKITLFAEIDLQDCPADADHQPILGSRLLLHLWHYFCTLHHVMKNKCSDHQRAYSVRVRTGKALQLQGSRNFPGRIRLCQCRCSREAVSCCMPYKVSPPR